MNLTANTQLKLKPRILVAVPVLFIFLLFFFVYLISGSLLKEGLTSQKVNRALTHFKVETAVELFSWENPYFIHAADLTKGNLPSAEGFIWRKLTKIHAGDERSLLGNELPGFNYFDTDILVAGEGTDYTNLPVESAPPIEYMEKQRGGTAAEGKKETPQPPAAVAGSQVFLYSTHSWESFLPLLGKAGAKDANQAVSANDDSKNIHVVDQWFKEALDKNGLKAAISDQNTWQGLINKGWQYPKSYNVSRSVVAGAVDSKQDYRLFIDVHRDSQRKDKTTAVINGKSYARVAFIFGKENKDYEKNLAVEKKLNDLIEKSYPGISRGVFGKAGAGVNGVYNQDLASNVILIEIGGVDNTEEELKNTVAALADIIQIYIKGDAPV